MQYGQVQQVKFGLFGKKVHTFQCGSNGMVLEKDSGGICLYGTDSNHKTIYCAVPLGPSRNLRGVNFYIFAYSERYMLLGAQRALFVIDFEEHFCATNVKGLKVFGSDAWGEQVTGEWTDAYLTLFGIPNPDARMDENAARKFWQWFASEEERIAAMASAGGSEGRQIVSEIDRHLTPVFPYERADNIHFELGCNDGVREFRFFHHNNQRLINDSETLKGFMPEVLRQRWIFSLQA